MQNNHLRYQDSYWKKTDPKEQAFRLVPSGSRVLDLGCWTGRLGEKLKKEKGCFVVGVDIDGEALSGAEKREDKVLAIDLDQPERLMKALESEVFDYILALDVLEHLKNPGKLLSSLKIFLKKNGKMIVSVPNVANIDVRLSLLLGKFEYMRSGILDETHLRFFTFSSIKSLLEKSGWKIEKVYSNGRKLRKVWPGLFAFQFIFVCQKKND